MKEHNRNIDTPPAYVLDPCLETVRTIRTVHDAREHTAALLALGFERVPAPLVARALGRSRSSTYALATPDGVGGLRALELLLVQRPVARVVLRGMLASVEAAPPPPPDGPSRFTVARVLARVLRLVERASNEDPVELDENILSERLKDFDEAEEELRRARAPYDRAALARKLGRGEKGGV